ncbi:MAG: hypothetical protein LUH11_01580 [Candidatus Gastranaerophilales bacterium]|nr:hypothetical protein [Candidatus Gastranaerophilales bacterium]
MATVLGSSSVNKVSVSSSMANYYTNLALKYKEEAEEFANLSKSYAEMAQAYTSGIDEKITEAESNLSNYISTAFENLQTNIESISESLDTVIANEENINIVATDISCINTTADNIDSVNIVKENISTINTTAENISDIITCSENITDIQNASTNAEIAMQKSSEAEISADNAKIWSEGTDIQVAALGGEHSSKVWASISADGQLQADWEQTDTSALDYIKNKPDISSLSGDFVDINLSNLSNDGKISMSSISMPSDTYTELTASNGSSYTAPANGWFVLSGMSGSSSSSSSYVQLCSKSNCFDSRVASYGQSLLDIAVFLPVLKGDSCRAKYSGLYSINWFRFYYAIGSESEAV